jgi:hypothetical protein
MTRLQLGGGRRILGAILVTMTLGGGGGVAWLHAQGMPEPQVLYWERDARPNAGTAVGMLYTPDVLFALASRIPDGAVPRAVANAIEQRTPIVVMWEVAAIDPQPLPPYRIAILDEHGPEGLIEPLWIQQQAGDMERLDGRLGSGGRRVAAIAAFPASAFVPGRRVLIRSTSPSTVLDSHTWTQRWGAIRWDGRAASDK